MVNRSRCFVACCHTIRCAPGASLPGETPGSRAGLGEQRRSLQVNACFMLVPLRDGERSRFAPSRPTNERLTGVSFAREAVRQHDRRIHSSPVSSRGRTYSALSVATRSTFVAVSAGTSVARMEEPPASSRKVAPAAKSNASTPRNGRTRSQSGSARIGSAVGAGVGAFKPALIRQWRVTPQTRRQRRG